MGEGSVLQPVARSMSHLVSSISSHISLRDAVTRRFMAIAGIACLVDLASKEAAVRALGENGLVTLTDRLSLVLVWNTGSAGGVSVGPFTWLINVVVTILAVGLVMSVVRQMSAIDSRATIALALVSGGAFGNLASMLAGPVGVADFIGIKLTEDTTMVANLADFFLWSGALLLVPVAFTLLRLARKERAQKARIRRMTILAKTA